MAAYRLKRARSTATEARSWRFRPPYPLRLLAWAEIGRSTLGDGRHRLVHAFLISSMALDRKSGRVPCGVRTSAFRPRRLLRN